MPHHLHTHRVNFSRPEIELDCSNSAPEDVTFFNRLPSQRPIPLLNEFSSLSGGDHTLLNQQADQLITPTFYPIHLDFSCVFSRLATYTQAFKSKASPRHLANAGFYWVGLATENEKLIRDKCVCFWCGYAASHWKATPSPSKTHAISRPDCPFVRNILKPIETEGMIETAVALWMNTPLAKFLEETAVARSVIEELLREVFVKKYPFPNLREAVLIMTDISEKQIMPRPPTCEADKCKICLDAQLATAFIPCGHAVCCMACSSRIQLCPICRSKICGRYLVLFS